MRVNALGFAFALLAATSLAAQLPPTKPADTNAPRTSERGEGRGAAADTPQNEPVYMPSRRFSFSVNLAPAPRITTIKLYASSDRGKSWRFYKEQTPKDGPFVVEAAGDGEFWFASQLVDVNNDVHPTGSLRAERKVIVDTNDPKLEFSAEPAPTGGIRCAWRVVDPNLDLNTLKLEYQTPQAKWTPLEIPSTAVTYERGVLIGNYDWHPETHSLVLDVRIEVADRSGRRAAKSLRAFLPKVAQKTDPSNSNGKAAEEGLTPAPRSESSQLTSVPWPRDNRLPPALATPPLDFEKKLETPVANKDAAKFSADPKQPAPPSGPGKLASTPTEPLPGAYKQVPGAVRPQVTAQVPNEELTNPRDSLQELNERAPDHKNPTSDKNGLRDNNLSHTNDHSYDGDRSKEQLNNSQENTPGHWSAAQRAEKSAGQAAPSNPTAPHPSDKTSAGDSPTANAEPWPTIPEGEPVRMTKVRSFYLDYELEAASPDSIQSIELWGTQDGGRSWEKWGPVPKSQTQMFVEVDHEGLYGFRVVVVDQTGLAGDVPNDGSPADLWVGVDATPPQTEITGVIYGTGARIGELDIRWTAQDVRLPERPITVSFSAAREGPWTTIAAGLPNSGQYYWKVERGVPPQVFLRIEVQDESGNKAEVVTRDAINLEGLVPKARIRDLRPTEDKPTSAAWLWHLWR